MASKLLGILFKNPGTKLMAIVLAVVLWLVVYNLDDPTKTGTFTTNVNIENTNYVTEQNLTYEIMDGTNTVTFSAIAKRSYLEKLEDTNFTATADLSRMVVDKDEQTAVVPIEIRSSIYNSEITYGEKQYLKLSLENLMSRQFQIYADSRGDVTEGCAVGNVKVTNPTVIKVSGPESIVSTVSKVVATIDVSDMSVDLSDNVVPVLLTEKNKEIDTTRLTLSSSYVTITAQILNTKEVPLNYKTSGSPADDYYMTGISANVSKLKVKGAASALNPLTSIEIPEEILNISGATEDIVTEVDITEYLPEGVELVDNTQRSITVTIAIDQYQTRTFSVPSQNIAIEGIPSGMTAVWKESTIDFKISGMEANLNQLDVSKLTGTVNVTGMKEGEHSVRIRLSLGDDYEVESARSAVILSK